MQTITVMIMSLLTLIQKTGNRSQNTKTSILCITGAKQNLKETSCYKKNFLTLTSSLISDNNLYVTIIIPLLQHSILSYAAD